MYRRLVTLLPLLALIAAPAYAELYKWVDAQGKTHYSDKPDGAGKAKVDELRTDAPPTKTAAAAPAVPDWKKQEAEYRQRQAQQASQRGANGPGTAAPVRPEGYRSGKVETDENRCRLARDVLSGAARHTSGARTDANDREVAQRDVGAFCH